ncbi:hypothetical protein ABIE26_005337 [Pedobacter africanus]|uniref:Uncharacterized protein n=1 Tax=Pedobacter africanus TaxID=151894 RepID=A0ACC6L4P4_9SPHI|nr:hypothetical protein [Pedobacter africanus]MDR6786476.1 hypothetical protein [Pedobacter africanus]
MSQTQAISNSLHSTRQYIDLFLTNLYALDMEKLNASQQLKVLSFYEQLIELLHSNTDLFNLIICPPD